VLREIEDAPESETALYARAVALHRLPEPQAALETVDRLLATRPEDPYYLELKGQLLFEMGRPGDAVPLYRRAVEALPGEPLLKAGLGRALLALETPEADAEALRVLESARRDDPGDAAALRSLATAYSRAGRTGMATLATAERFALIGRVEDAVLHAERAAGLLPEGSPGWIRAQDILAMKRS
jgi:predicted Zn-dependent protease